MPADDYRLMLQALEYLGLARKQILGRDDHHVFVELRLPDVAAIADVRANLRREGGLEGARHRECERMKMLATGDRQAPWSEAACRRAARYNRRLMF